MFLRRLAYVLRVLRLIVLMLVGAGFGFLPRLSDSRVEAAAEEFSGAVLGGAVRIGS